MPCLKRWQRRALFTLALLLLVFSVTPWGQEFWGKLFTHSGFGDYRPAAERPLLRIHVIDVGKADAILFECAGETALLDAGTGADGGDVVDYLLRHGIDALDYAIMSHPDSDHIGGMAQVLRELPVGSFLRGALPAGFAAAGQEYSAMQDALAAREIPTWELASGESFSLGSAVCEVLGPVQAYEGTNDASLIFRLCCGNFRALFCGDIESDAELDLCKSGQDLTADLLKVPHHGSATSTTERLLEAVSPQWAVISVGPDNNELPREEVLRRLEEYDAEIYRTDVDGTVVFSFDGERLSIETERNH